VSKRTLLVLALVCAAVWALVLLDVAAGGGGEGPRRLVDGSASAIRAVSATDGAVRVAIERSGGSGPWLVIEERDGRRSSWPASENRRAPGFRLLAEARITPLRDAPGGVEGGIDVTIDDGNGPARLRLAARGVSGRRPAQLDDQAGAVEEPVAAMLAPESLTAWRDGAVCPGIDAGVRSIVIETVGRPRLVLRRVGGRWGLTEPVAAPADGEAVAALLGSIASASFDRFGGELSDARATLIIGTDGDPFAPVRGWSVSVARDGAAAARLLGPAMEVAITGVLPAAAAAWADAEAGGLISRVAVDAPASDVAALVVRRSGVSERIERDGRGWTDRGEGADAVLGLLCASPADEVGLAPAPSAPGITLDLERFGGLPIRSFGVSIEPGFVIVNAGGVEHRYARGPASVEAAAALLSDADG
jgi:hypothetical protein